MADLTRTYHGPSGRLTLPTRTVQVTDGEPIEVDADEAAVLDALPEFGGGEIGTEAGQPLPVTAPDGLAPEQLAVWAEAVAPLIDMDKPALLAFAAEHGIEVNARLGEPKLRQAIADALHEDETPDTPDPQGDEPASQEPTP